LSPTHEEEQRQSRDLSFSDQKHFSFIQKMKVLFEEENVTVHGKAVPETGQVSVVEYENPFKRELIWDPVAAGEWTFLGPSEYDSGFRVDLSQILTLRRPATEGNGLRYLVIQLKDGAVLPSLHFTPGGVDRTCRCLNIFFKFKDSETEPGTLMVEAVEPPKGNNLSIWEDDPTERKKNQSNRDIVNQEMISKSNHDSNKTIMIRG